MDRREFLTKSGVAAAGVGLVGGAGKSAAAANRVSLADLPDIEWEMPTSWPLNLDTIYGGAEVFAEEVGRLTGGKFVITPRAGGEVVPGLEVLQNVQSGAYPVGHTASYYYIGLAPVDGVRHGAAVRSQLAPAERLAVRGWRPDDAAGAVRPDVRGDPVPGRQHRLPDGRLVPRGDHVRRRPRRLEDAHRRLRRAR